MWATERKLKWANDWVWQGGELGSRELFVEIPKMEIEDVNEN